MAVPPSHVELLRPHQVEPARRLLSILQTVNSAFDLSDTGIGKTYVGAYVASQLKIPTLVVCPYIAQSVWRRAAAHFGDKFSIVNYEMLRTGRTPYGYWDNTPPPGFKREEYFVCQCCDCRVNFDEFYPCYVHRRGIHCIETKKAKWRYGDFHFHPGAQLIIFDEAHRTGEIDSLHAKIAMAAHDRKTLCLSATAASSPLQMQALGYLGALHRGGNDFYNWARRHGCRKDLQHHFRWMASKADQTTIMASIHDRLMERGVRVRVEDVPDFPEREITAELYDLAEADTINRLYEEMADSLKVVDDKIAQDVETPLTKFLRAHQKIELLKVPIAVELAHDYVAKGCSVVLFVNYRQTLVELRKRLKCDCFIDGSPEGVRLREQNLDNFQENRERRIICNSAAASECISMQDLYGGHPRVGLVFPSFKAVTTRQLCGRLHRSGGKSKCHYRFLFADKTVETKIHATLSTRLNNLDTLNDCDMMPENLQLSRVSLVDIF